MRLFRILLRVLHHTSRALVVAIVFVLATVGGLWTHLNSGLVRRVIASQVEGVLASSLRGKLVIDSIGAIGLHGIDQADVRVFDDSGKLVAAAYGVRAHIAIGELLRSLGGTGPLVVHLSDAAARAVDFDVDVDDAGQLGVQRAFASRGPEGGPPGRAVRLALDRIDVAHVWAHGKPAPGLAVDADVDALSASVDVAERVEVDVTHLTLMTRGMPSGADARGSLEAHLKVPAPSGGAVAARGAWNGSVAGIATTASASIDGALVAAALDAPEVTPDAVRALWPASPIDSTSALHADVEGTLPRLVVHLRSTRGEASLDISGPVVVGATQTADLHVEARDIDTHALILSAPRSHLSAAGDVSITRIPSGAVTAKAAIDFKGGHIAGESVPSGKIHATASLEPGKGLRADGNVTANEPGAPTVLAVHLAPKGHAYELTFAGDTRVRALDAVPRLGPVARGSTEVSTKGVIDLAKGKVDVSLKAEVHELGHDVMNVRHASLDAHVRGTLRAPQIDVALHGDVLDFGGYRFSALDVEVHGPAGNAQIRASLDADGDGTPDFGAEGELSVGDATKIDKIHVRMARASEKVAIHVGEIKIAQGTISAEPIEIDGLGEPVRASFESSLGVARIRVQGADLDLARFERVSRVEGSLGGCTAAVDVDLALRRDGADGHASLGLTKCAFKNVGGGSAALDATFDGRKIAGRAHFAMDDVGTFELTSSSIDVGGTGPLYETWKKAFGRVKFDGSVDVGKLAAHLPRHSIPLDHLRGTVSIQGRVERDSPTDDTPGLNLSVTTAGLAVVGPSTRTTGVDGTPVLTPPAWHLDGIDLGIDARIDGDSGFAELSGRLNDPKGELIALDLKSGAVPYGALLDKPSQALSLLESVPFNAHVVVPSRDIADLPKVLQLKTVRGALAGDVTATGSLTSPAFDIDVKLGKGRAEQAISFPVDFELKAHYDGARAAGTLAGIARKGKVLEAGFAADARASDFLHGDFSTWTVSGAAHLDALPLESLSALSDRQISGSLTGDVKLDGFHKDASASANVQVEGLKVGDVACKTGTLSAKVDGKALAAEVHLDQNDGSLDATAQAATKWGAALAPSLDDSRPPSGELHAKRLRAALFLPFVDNSFTELDGRIDADLRVAFDAGRPRTQGKVAISQGRFELAAIGGEFHDVQATATFSPDGGVKLEGVRAAAMSGVIEAAASARLNGFALEGANATLQIPRSSPLLLTVQGAQVGTVEGKADVAVRATPGTLDVKVQIPTLHVELPLAPSRDVQALGELDAVHVGIDEEGGAFVAERLDAPRETVAAPPGKSVVTTITLGDDVFVKKGTDLSVALRGAPVITVADAVRVNGQVRLVGGKIDVQGKPFDIESGAVTFQGDPSDPQMVVTASFTAPDQTKVYAELRGTLKNPKVNLRSEPSYSKNEIIALLVYGSVDATTPNSGAAAGVAGGAATQPLNRALENLGLGGVSTRVDTSDVTPRADVEFQIARDLSLQLAQVMGVPPPGTNPDVTLLTLSWRFARAWSTLATVGNAGTTIGDILWTHRY